MGQAIQPPPQHFISQAEQRLGCKKGPLLSTNQKERLQVVTVALDLGSITGFAVKSPHGFSSGTLSFKKKGKFHDSGYKALYDFLGTFLEGPHEHPDLEIVVEKPHAGRFMA